MLLSNSYDRKIGKLTASQHVHNLFIYLFFLNLLPGTAKREP